MLIDPSAALAVSRGKHKIAPTYAEVHSGNKQLQCKLRFIVLVTVIRSCSHLYPYTILPLHNLNTPCFCKQSISPFSLSLSPSLSTQIIPSREKQPPNHALLRLAVHTVACPYLRTADRGLFSIFKSFSITNLNPLLIHLPTPTQQWPNQLDQNPRQCPQSLDQKTSSSLSPI